MTAWSYLRSHPRLLAIACAAGATAAGVAYLSAAGAPASYLAINVAALVIGLVGVRVMVLLEGGPAGTPAAGLSALALASALLATAWFGVSVEGAARWVRVGALTLQPSLVVAPLLVVLHARSRDRASALAVLVAALALALQPDRAMAGALALGAGAVALARPGRSAIAAFLGASAGFAVTLARADALPAVPYVDQVFQTAFGVGPVAGLAALGGTALLLAPPLIGTYGDAANRHVHAAFGAIWFGTIVAAALGNYPTPVVGYGGSAIVGYLLSLALLPGRIGSGQATPQAAGGPRRSENDRHLPMQAAG